MTRYVCIHGHFYQPPRENAWTGCVDLQPSALPFHDWNERVCSECYRVNANARILDPPGRIREITSNYDHLSFDFGPTLLSWLESEAPEVYAEVLSADRRGGGGMAQAYNHMILPLANARDQATQVKWGMADFEHRFGRRATGMWLPETAVDIPTLEALASEGIAYTVLATHQAKQAVDAGGAYRVRLPSRRSIAVFFYDEELARIVAFESALGDGFKLGSRLAGEGGLLTHYAADGETYGHHHRFGEMGLAAALERVRETAGVEVTNYAAFLQAHPPRAGREMEIVEATSWSCAHGIERWRADCGCHAGGQSGWRQAWRAPLRQTLDWLRDQLAAGFEQAGTGLWRDPWAARDAYIEVVQRPDRWESFCRGQGTPSVRRRQARDLLEMQRFAMLMYTSCGWFFDEISGIETVQILQYAARAMELAESALGMDLETEFRQRLEVAPSNLAAYGNGRGVYEQLVGPARSQALTARMTAAARACAAHPEDEAAWARWEALARGASQAWFPVDLWPSQTVYWEQSAVGGRQSAVLAKLLGFSSEIGRGAGKANQRI